MDTQVSVSGQGVDLWTKSYIYDQAWKEDKYNPRKIPHGLKHEHVLFIQRLRDEGKTRNETVTSTVARFPELFKVMEGRGEEERVGMIETKVHIWYSCHADRADEKANGEDDRKATEESVKMPRGKTVGVRIKRVRRQR
ncbi:MAG: hypothetical protein Q9214_002413 [Letrouitia sp. 1 TL-2023]